MFYSVDVFRSIPKLAKHWEIIRDELDGLAQNAFMKWPETDIYDGNWTVFPLFKIGQRVERNCLLCPETSHMLAAVPGMVNAGFSSLAPGTYIGPHHGYTNKVLRCHIGLRPSEDSAIRVGEEVRSWSAGSSFVFDDTIEHEAWNWGTRIRTILLFDFKRNPEQEVSFPEVVYLY